MWRRGLLQREVCLGLALENVTTKKWRRGVLMLFDFFDFFRSDGGKEFKKNFDWNFDFEGFWDGKLGKTSTKKWRRGSQCCSIFFAFFGRTDEKNLRKILLYRVYNVKFMLEVFVEQEKNRTTLDHPCSDFSKSGGEGCFQREVWFSLALESLTTKKWRRGGLTMFVRFFMIFFGWTNEI